MKDYKFPTFIREDPLFRNDVKLHYNNLKIDVLLFYQKHGWPEELPEMVNPPLGAVELPHMAYQRIVFLLASTCFNPC